MEQIEIITDGIEEKIEYKEIIKEVLDKCFKEEELGKHITITVTLTNPENIRNINKKYRQIDNPTDVLSFPMYEKEEISEDSKIFEGKTFVITGSVHHFSNRNALKSLIESKGGKVAGSVSSKTHYLINNDAESTSSKNKKARELGIPILTEDDFLKLLQ